MKSPFTYILNKSKSIHQQQSGFSVMELLIGMVIFLVVTGSIYGLLYMGSISKNRASRRTDVLKNARAAIHLIGRDALNAGLHYHQKGAIVPDDFISNTLGTPQDADNDRDILTSVIAGDNLFNNDLQSSSTEKTDTIAFAYGDLNFNNGDTIDLKESKQGASASTTRLEFKDAQTSNVNPYDLMLVEAGSTQVAVMASSIIDSKNIDLALNDPLGINLAHNGSGVNRTLLFECNPPSDVDDCTNSITSLKRFYWVSYKVKQDGTLVRIVYGNNTGRPFDEQIQEQPLAYNVKDLQFKYVLEDGTVTDNPAAGPDGTVGTADDEPNNFNLIRQVTVTITVQSTELDEQTKKPETIELDATFSVRNLQYDVG